jgi:hypothetical protein
VARSSRLEGNCYVTRISDKVCVITLKSRAHILTNHNHTVLTTQLLRDQETAHHASRIHGCVVVGNEAWKVGFQEQFRESVRLKRVIATAAPVCRVYFLTRSRTGEERVSWNTKILSNEKHHCRNWQSETPPLDTRHSVKYKNGTKHCAVKPQTRKAQFAETVMKYWSCGVKPVSDRLAYRITLEAPT